MTQRAAVAHITSAHKADDIRIRHKECRSLVEAGYDVTLVSSRPGDAFDDGVSVDLIAATGGRLERMLKSPFRLAAAVSRLHPNIVHFHDPELLPLGLWLALCGKRVVYDVHEDVPRQIENKHYLAAPLRKPMAWLVEALEWVAGRSFAAIVAATPEIARRFSADRTIVLQNFPKRSEFTTATGGDYLQRSARFAYVGGISAPRGIREMVEATELVLERGDVGLELAGGFSPSSLEHEIAQLSGWSKVHYHGWLSRDATVNLLHLCRAGLVVLHPISNYVKSQPIKLYEYMAAGLPVIASDFPLWRKIVDGAECGLLVDPLDPASIAQAMTWILDHPEEAAAMGERGRVAVESRFNWEAERHKLLALYTRLAPLPPSAPKKLN